MRKFQVTKSSNPKNKGKVFHSETAIKTENLLGFLEKEYRCSYFNGFEIKLVRGDEYIIGVLK